MSGDKIRAQLAFELMVDFGIALAFIVALAAGFYGFTKSYGLISSNAITAAKYAYNATASLARGSHVMILGG